MVLLHVSSEIHTKFKVALGKKIQTLRETRGLTQKDLAFETDLDISTISRLERGILNPRLETVLSISSVFEIPPKKLLDI